MSTSSNAPPETVLLDWLPQLTFNCPPLPLPRESSVALSMGFSMAMLTAIVLNVLSCIAQLCPNPAYHCTTTKCLAQAASAPASCSHQRGCLQVKVWSVQSGFCFVTFSDHKAPVTAVAFLPSGSVVVSASLDGTVRAFDLVRYRNFRTMTSPHPVQFVSLAVDPAGEVSLDSLITH